MYLSHVKATLVKGMKETFDNTYHALEYRGINVSIEYPIREIEYPAIWVDFTPVGRTEIVGIGHVEDVAGEKRYRYRFAGTCSFTLVAMSSFERDRLYDEVLGVLSFSKAEDNRSKFRETIEAGQWVAMDLNFDQIDQRGFGFQQGTPWGTDDMVYEATLGIEATGEYISDTTGQIQYVSGVTVYTWFEGTVPTGVPGGDGWIGEMPTPPLGYELG
jgi:hypothetical protein